MAAHDALEEATTLSGFPSVPGKKGGSPPKNAIPSSHKWGA